MSAAPHTNAQAATRRNSRAEEIRRGLELLIGPDGVHELRIPKAGRFKTVSGYFDNLDALARAADEWDGKAPGIYVTLNPNMAALLSRAANRAKAYAEHATSDVDIVDRRRLFIDCDPNRPAGIAATNAEHEAALERARAIRARLHALDCPDPILIDSGNGAYLIYAIDLPNDTESLVLVSSVLDGIASEFGDADIKIDSTVSNAARIGRIPGTLNCKGDDTPERPHRRAAILETPAELQPVSIELLRQLAAWSPKPEEAPRRANGNGAGVDLDGFIREHGLEVQSDTHEWQPGKRRIRLRVCPFNANHTGGSAALFGFASGAVAFRCLHDGCHGRGWPELRQHFEGPRATTRRDSTGARAGTEERERDSERRAICITGRQLDDLVAAAIAALVETNEPPRLFMRSGFVVRARRDENGTPRIDQLGDVALLEELSRTADWTRRDAEGAMHPAHPTRSLAGVVLASLARDEGAFPALHGIAESPILHADGSLWAREGYDPETRTYYAPAPGFTMPEVPAALSEPGRVAAIETVGELFRDFPFESEADKATAWAALSTMLLRSMIAGPAPLFDFDAPSQGTGKTLLARALAVVATGREPAMMAPPGDRDDSEMRKRITATLLDGVPLAIIDNLEQPLGSASLASVLTAGTWSDRLLGRSERVTLPARTVWLVTGNNLRLRGDLPRRSVRCRLNAKLARPWTRERFTHADLIGWAHSHRGQILAAAYGLARMWLSAGQPPPGNEVPRIGGYEEWRRVVGGVLGLAEIPGFLANLIALWEQLDEDTPAWSEFLSTWRAATVEPMTAAQLVDLIGAPGESSERSTLRDALPPELESVWGDPNFTRRLGAALRKRKDTRFPGENAASLWVCTAGKEHQAVRWRVEREGSQGVQGVPCPLHVERKEDS